MSPIQNLNKRLQTPIVITLTIILILTICSAFSLPKLSSRIFPQKQNEIFTNFESSVEKDKGINPQEYWKFREFYSPGTFTLSKKGIRTGISDKLLLQSYIRLNNNIFPFLEFSSKNLSSVDYLTGKSNLAENISILTTPKVIYQTEKLMIYKLDNDNIVILFLLPAEEMKNANGFFDYSDEDKNITNGKFWLNITKLETS